MSPKEKISSIVDVLFVGSPVMAAVIRLAYLERLYMTNDLEPLWSAWHAWLLLVEFEILAGMIAFAVLAWRVVSKRSSRKKAELQRRGEGGREGQELMAISTRGGEGSACSTVRER